MLTIAINFISSKDAEEGRVMHSKSDNEKFMICDNANDIVDKCFKSLISRYQFRNINDEVILYFVESNFCITNVTE